MIFADLPLARLLETAEVANARAFTQTTTPPLEVAGGCAVFAGIGSPLSHAVGVWLHGPVR